MFTRKHIVVMAFTLTLVNGFAPYPASATQFQKCHPLAQCSSKGSLSGRLVDSGRTSIHRSISPRSRSLYPYYGDYNFQYQPPLTTNGPYYGYEPYNGFQSSLGFSF